MLIESKLTEVQRRSVFLVCQVNWLAMASRQKLRSLRRACGSAC